MRIRIPGKDVHVRVFEPVATTDEQYDVFDTGLEYGDGTIDSIVVGGSFATLKRLAANADAEALKKRQEETEVSVTAA